MRRVHLALLSVAAVCLCACAGPPVPTPIAGEPVCPDFEVGATKTVMRGGLRLPVAVTISDGKNPILRTTVVGLRSDKDTPTRVLLPDDNGEFTVEWAQCENERAPRPANAAPQAKPKSTAAPLKEPVVDYECGKATAYKTEKLVTKKGDLASHALTFPAPPKTECWLPEAPPKAAEPAETAQPAIADAGAEPAPTASASAAPTASASAAKPAADAGVKKKKSE